MFERLIQKIGLSATLVAHSVATALRAPYQSMRVSPLEHVLQSVHDDSRPHAKFGGLNFKVKRCRKVKFLLLVSVVRQKVYSDRLNSTSAN